MTTDKDLENLIEAYNTEDFPSFFALRTLTPTVVLGYIWPERPSGKCANESSLTVYFILNDDGCCVGIVLVMGKSDLHWLVLEKYRRQGHLHRALRDCILPHLFRDGRPRQFATADDPDEEIKRGKVEYAERQGFTRDGTTYSGAIQLVMKASQVDISCAPTGTNTRLSTNDFDALKERLREAGGLIRSVHEALMCSDADNKLNLDILADSVSDQAFELPPPIEV